MAAKACIELVNCGFKSFDVAVSMQESQMEMHEDAWSFTCQSKK